MDFWFCKPPQVLYEHAQVVQLLPLEACLPQLTCRASKVSVVCPSTQAPCLPSTFPVAWPVALRSCSQTTVRFWATPVGHCPHFSKNLSAISPGIGRSPTSSTARQCDSHRSARQDAPCIQMPAASACSYPCTRCSQRGCCQRRYSQSGYTSKQ